MNASTLGLLLLRWWVADVAPWPAPPPKPVPPPVTLPSPDCRSDAECVVTTFAGCCGSCCPPAPYAISAARLEQERARCALVDCARPAPCPDDCRPPPAPGETRAACVSGACRLVSVEVPPGVRCDRDDQCTVTYDAPGPLAACRRSPCGCCPGTQPRAVRVGSEDRRPAVPLTKPEGAKPGSAPPFGLSSGPTAPAPACAPCQSPQPARAQCVAHRCALTPPGDGISPTRR
jgi:hypothetical protein